jgi:chromosome segregation ATPase
MNRYFASANFVGIMLLCCLSVLQWRTNSGLEDSVRRLDALRVEQSATIDQQKATITRNDADMDDLRERLSAAESDLKSALQERDQFAGEEKQLKKSLGLWVAAVNQRDAALKQYAEAIQKLAAQRNDAISKYNDLANKYNSLAAEGGGQK